MKNAVQTPRERSEGVMKKNPRQHIRIPRYMGWRTKEYTPESINLGWPVVFPKTVSCDFNARYIPKLNDKIAGSKSKGKEVKSIETVETLNKK
jgi:hypothetical protein